MEKILEIKEKYTNLAEKYNKDSRKFSNLRLLNVLIIAGVALANFTKLLTFPYIIILLALLICFAIIVRKEQLADDLSGQAKSVIDTALLYEKRKNGQWTKFEETGEEFIEEKDYAYIEDLQILGENSLFQYLNCAKTKGGKRKLVAKFRNAFKETPENIKKKAKLSQDAIFELTENPELLLLFQGALGKIEKINEIDAEDEKDAFTMERKFSYLDFAISLILSAVTIVVAIMSKYNIHCLLVLLPLVFIQFVSALVYQNSFDKELSKTGKNLRKVTELKAVCDLFENENFNSAELCNLKDKLNACQEVLKKLKKIDALESFRRNFLMWFLGNIFLSLNRFIIREYGKIQKEDKLKLYEAISAMEDLEVLISLGTINIVKDNVSAPEFSEELVLECENIKHPLIVEEICKGNDFKSKREINVITGSNMSGKTSFMKTIGVNLILAYSGGWINGEGFMCPIVKIYTSINVKDDINKGISKFYAELLRLKEAMKSAKNGGKMILFVDEIFSGTNYQDRIFGAKNIIQQLSNENVMGFITTHDFELCEIPCDNLANYHFTEEYVNGKMQFSHKINEGKCHGTNAVALMKETGLLAD